MVTIVLGLVAAIGWGAPDPWVARGIRAVGPFPIVFGSIVVGAVLVAPGVLFVETPDWTARALLLAPLVGVLTAVGFQAGFSAFQVGSVSVVAPIIACEGAVAAALAIAGGERLDTLILVGLPLAVIGVVLVSMSGGEGTAGWKPAAVAAVLWGGVLAFSAPITDDVGPYWAFVLVRGSAVILMLPFAFATDAPRRALGARFEVVLWGVADAAAYLSFVIALDHGSAAVAGVLAAQFGTVAALVAVALFGERLLPRQVAGIVLVAVAVAAIAAGSE